MTKDKYFESYAQKQVENFAFCCDWWERHKDFPKCSFIGAIKNIKPEFEGDTGTVKQFDRTLIYDAAGNFQAPGIFGFRRADGKFVFYELRPNGISYEYLNPAISSVEEIKEFIGDAYVSKC